MYVKRYLALFFSVIFAITALPAVSLVADNQAEIDHAFKYAGPNAKAVSIAGEFSNWSELPMTRDESGTWSRTVHLRPGYYGYKLVVDGEWILDPVSSARKEVNDIEDSAVSAGGVLPPVAALVPAVSGKTSTVFSYTDASAQSVHLAGEFNGWLDNIDGKVTGHTEWLLRNDGSGNWKLNVPLALGKHTFKYVIDGGARWEDDPHLPVAPDGNSIIEVQAPGVAPVSQAGASGPRSQGAGGVSFSYSDPIAKSVSVAGEFNQWSTTANPMQKDQQGIWIAMIPLKPGKYLYKLVVDGTWKADPLSPDGDDDGFGGKNSVKTVNPGL
jgi:1,4-alpha-glucan branching enzyme